VQIKNNFDKILVAVILFFHFLYLAEIYIFPLYHAYDYYLRITTDFRDFYWYPSNALINKVNIFDLYFKSDIVRNYQPGHPPPNYSILHTIFFLPFGFFDFEFSKKIYLMVNILLLFFIYQILRNNYKKNKIFLLFILFLFSPLLLHLLKVGQYTIFCLWGFIIFFYTNENSFLKFIGLLISTLKYTFAPIIVLYLLLEKKFKIIFFLILTNIIAVIFYSIYFNISFISALLNPIFMGWKTQAIGVGDLLSFLGNYPKFPYNVIIVGIIFFLLKYFIYHNTKRQKAHDLVLICILTLISFKHLSYDYVFLLPVILLLFNTISRKDKNILSLIIFYFLYILPWALIEPIRYTKYFIFFNLSLNFYLLVITLRLTIKKTLKLKIY